MCSCGHVTMRTWPNDGAANVPKGVSGWKVPNAAPSHTFTFKFGIMKPHALITGACVVVLTASATYYIPPDYYQEKYMPSIGFWENIGQVIDTQGNKREDVKYYTTGSIPQVYLRTDSRISFAIHKVDTNLATIDTIYHLQMQPWGENAAEEDPAGTVLKTSHLNYLLPHCGEDGITLVQGFSRVIYEEIFPFIDLHFYSGGFGQKMAFVLRPGADPAHLILRFTGQDSLVHDAWDNLKFYHDGKYFVLPHAVAYQVNADSTTIPVSWNATYDADEEAGIIKFEWSEYDPEKPLVFLVGPPPAMGGQVTTPGVCWGTYLGGDGGDRIYASDTDDEGNYYVGGFTYSQAIYFPEVVGIVPFQASPVAVVSKFGSDYGIHWSTFYGGSEFVGASPHQWVRGMKVRPGLDPNILIGGRSATSNLWCIDPLDDSYYDDAGPGGGGFLAELNHLGQGIWSTYFGNGVISVLNLDLHPLGEIAVCGDVSDGSIPEEQDTAPAQSEHWNNMGDGDGWIAMLKPARRTYWCTFMGGSDYDYLRSVRFGTEKVVFVGSTFSSDFPVLDGGANAHDSTFAGGEDVTISEFTLDGEYQWGTFLGGLEYERPGYQGLVVRPSALGDEDVFIVGFTSSTDFPMTVGSGWHNPDLLSSSYWSGFIARFSGADRSRMWSTYVNGGQSNDGETWLEAVELDGADRLFVGGYTLTSGFPYQDAWNLYSTTAEYGAWDGVLLCFDATQELRWATRFGGDEDGVLGERIETLCTWSDERLFAAGITYAVYGPDVFFPLTDPVGDDDYFDDVFYPEWDAFLAGFCIEGLLTSFADRHQQPSFSSRQLTSGVHELVGLPLDPVSLIVSDATGRLVAYQEVMRGVRAIVDLRRFSEGVYVVSVEGLGALRLHNVH